MEQRKDTKWNKIRKDLNEVAQILAQLSNAALMIDADLRSMRKELTDAGQLKPIETATDPEVVKEEMKQDIINGQPEEAKTEDYFPAKSGTEQSDETSSTDSAK